MICLLSKLEIFLKLLFDTRFRMDAKAFQASSPEFVYRAWNLLKELNLKRDFENGITISSLKRKGIKHERMLSCMLDLLVGQGILKFENHKYYFVKEPKPITKEQFSYLQKHYPGSTEWADFVTARARKTLLSGKPPKDTGFEGEESLRLWDAIMQESPHSFRKMAIEKMLSKVKPNASILDLGCGGGIGLKTILQNAKKDIFLDGAEVSSEYLEKAKNQIKKMSGHAKNKLLKRNLERVKLIHYDKKDFVPKGKKYDAVFISIVLNHLIENQREKLFQEIKEILKPNGFLVVFQLIHQSKFERNPICWLMHTIPSHHEYPFKERHLKSIKNQFGKVKEHLNGIIVEASR